MLSSQRANLYAMVPAGKALAAEFGLAVTYPQASGGFGLVALAAGSNTSKAMEEMRRILANYAREGVPPGIGGRGQTQRSGQ